MSTSGSAAAAALPTTATIAWPECSSDGDDLKKKLLNDSTIDAVTKVNLIQSFLTWLPNFSSSSTTSSACDETKSLLDYQKLVVMLNHCEEAMAKSQQMLTLNQVEMRNYEDLYVRIETGIKDAHRKILHFKKQLMISDQQQQQPMEACSSSSDDDKQLINKEDGAVNRAEEVVLSEEEKKLKAEERKKTLTWLTMLEMEVKKLQMIRDDLNRKLMKRKKQCESLVATAHQLRGLFVENSRIQQQMLQSSQSSSQFINSSTNTGWSLAGKFKLSDSTPVFV